ncbi:hypothetical protein EYC80_010345 [Monilinia laxa]|uniref:RRM domain-containing protein n=1 Tax=Monilinia laxa TaxID=61186 RepID=A0A5N6JQ38_MONLA|nr:hypothetical protein EYC80_010345 [Monilinia laxa]
MAHPPFGTFKFLYSPLGTIDYESCFGAEENAYLDTLRVVNYPRPSLSWLHVLPNFPIEDERESEVSGAADDQTIYPDINSLAKASEPVSVLSEPALIRQPESSVIPRKAMYIPPHKRVYANTSHSRDQSELSVPASKSAISGSKKKRYQSLDLTPSQKALNVPRRISTGSAYVPFLGFQPILALDPVDAKSTKTNLQIKVRLSDQTKYKGTGQGTKAIENLEDHLNCSVFVKYLPQDVQFHEIFAIINTGSVICLHIMLPTHGHCFAAAKIIFKYTEGAARFIKANKQREFRIRDHRLTVVYNDHGMVRHAQEHQSRVIYIEGPFSKMNEIFWRGYFETITNFNLEYVGYLPTDQATNGARMMEFRFSRVEAQAQTILIAILNDHQFDGTVTARYGDDPCGITWDTLPKN